MNYEEALQYIHSVNWTFCNLGLERIKTLCEKLGNPQDKLKFIHVAGTNGKGSVCAMLDSILRKAGYRTGIYTSPYIKCFNERMRVDGMNISNEELAELTELVRPIADEMEEKPTEFELITAIAFEYFHRHQCDVVILEVGLGGRLDSTNVIKEPLLSIITGIDFDHTKLLGNTLQHIAAEKAGIVKEGCPCVYGGNSTSACRIISAISATRHAPFYTVDRRKFTLHSMTLDGTQFDFGEYKNLSLSLLGVHQLINVQTVMTAVELLPSRGLEISEEALRAGLREVTWPARFEKLSADPLIIYDGAHNPQGIRALIRSLERYFPDQKVNIISGVMADKEYGEMVEKLKTVAEHVYTVTVPDNPRALSAESFANVFARQDVPVTACESLSQAVSLAVSASRENGIPLFCVGSLYLYQSLSREIAEALN